AAAADAAANASAATGVACGSNRATCGTQVCISTTTNTDALSAGCLYAKDNGFVTAGNVSVNLVANSSTYNAGPPVTITNAPPGSSGVAPNYWVQANISTSPLNLFGPIGAAFNRFTIKASSIAA